jgi:predicted MPP superfamily phosphohydrolase
VLNSNASDSPPLAATVPPVSRSKSRIEVRRFAGPLAHCEHIKSLRVAHLTDLHVGAVTPMSVQYDAVRLTNSLAPDLIAITGDFVCHSQVYLDNLYEVIRSFRAPVFCVLGNHDHWSGGTAVRKTLKRAGAEVLDNANTSITIRHQTLQVVGLDDAYTGHADWRKATDGLNDKYPTLGLSHIGEEADALWTQGISLVLAGHTHAGQITVARLHELAMGKLVGHRYVHGLYGDRKHEKHRGALYVGAGIGAAIVPFRVGERARREIAVFELGSQPGSLIEHHNEQTALAGRKPSEKKMRRRQEHAKRKSARWSKKPK